MSFKLSGYPNKIFEAIADYEQHLSTEFEKVSRTDRGNTTTFTITLEPEHFKIIQIKVFRKRKTTDIDRIHMTLQELNEPEQDDSFRNEDLPAEFILPFARICETYGIELFDFRNQSVFLYYQREAMKESIRNFQRLPPQTRLATPRNLLKILLDNELARLPLLPPEANIKSALPEGFYAHKTHLFFFSPKIGGTHGIPAPEDLDNAWAQLCWHFKNPEQRETKLTEMEEEMEEEAEAEKQRPIRKRSRADAIGDECAGLLKEAETLLCKTPPPTIEPPPPLLHRARASAAVAAPPDDEEDEEEEEEEEV